MNRRAYRDNGAIGALLDEYERAIQEMKELLETVSQEELINIVDTETNDPDCRSIQTIMTHVVRAGFYYATAIRIHLGEETEIQGNQLLDSVPDYIHALDEMFRYNELLFEDYPDLVIEEKDHQKKVLVSWGQIYDIEQLFEHAIVHILRHRRQIERFLIRLRN